jgi:NADPH-dependent 2,4-dienoyl-CoA reductase/sulfur reductase-like enzyme
MGTGVPDVYAAGDCAVTYYLGAHEIRLRLTGEPAGGRLLGAQLAGHVDAQVAKRVDIVAAALFRGLEGDSLNDLDLSYSPPFGSPCDVVQHGAQEWSRQRALNGTAAAG